VTYLLNQYQLQQFDLAGAIAKKAQQLLQVTKLHRREKQLQR
jgi:hypothetical protein